MSSQKQQVTIRDLVEEAKKRIVVLGICVVGLSYLMSLTSSSVWVNLPAAASLIVILRYLSLDFEMRRKAATCNNRKPANTLNQSKRPESQKAVNKSEWRRKVNSPVVEDSIDHFTRHLVSEWVTDIWYSKLTPDKEGPEELVYIMNGVLAEISVRMKNINLIDFLTRDLINLFCNHLELFRATQAKIEQYGTLTIEQRDMKLRLALSAENKLHPALFSSEAEHKVLQYLADGLISYTFKHEDLQCSFFRYISRELLACAVIRPVLNLANPRFINERIESLVINMTKSSKTFNAVHETSLPKPDAPGKVSSDHFSRFVDPSVTGVELVQLKHDQSRDAVVTPEDSVNGNISKDPLLSVHTQTSHSWSSISSKSPRTDEGIIKRNHSSGEWGEMLDLISRRKTHALAPEHFENMWTKGKNYRKKDGENGSGEKVTNGSSHVKLPNVNNIKAISQSKEKETIAGLNPSDSILNQSRTSDHFKNANSSHLAVQKIPSHSFLNSYREDCEENTICEEKAESGSSTSYTSEDEENDTITGLDSPGTKVWDSRSNRNMTISHIHHPLEKSDGRVAKKSDKGNLQHHRLPKPGQKRSRPDNQKLHVWQEVERTSFFSRDGKDILSSPKRHANDAEPDDDSETESLGRLHSRAAASSSAPFISKSHSVTVNTLKNSLAVDSFYKLKCEVVGANIVKSGSKMFAVYSISVTDGNNHSWSIKRRFRHFEELHRRLKEFPEYNLHLPPKHFLSTGLDVPVIRERCELLDNYVKKVMQLPTISGSIEVWDFLSVDSQTYIFSNSFSIVETLSVDLDDKQSEMSKRAANSSGLVTDNFSSKKEPLGTGTREPPLQMKNNFVADGFILKPKGNPTSPLKSPSKETRKSLVNSGGDLEHRAHSDASLLRNSGRAGKDRENHEVDNTSNLLLDAATDPTIPTEWVPPNLSAPILDLVDVIFQLQDGGWIRRKAFWVAKQILQLGMGDAFDDWLLGKIQLLRKGSVIASGIKRLEQILWPDGIFITKHPKRRPPPSTNLSQGSPCSQQKTEVLSPKVGDEQQLEAQRRAKFVYELMIENAPAAIVGLVGRKEYEQCAKDLYFFIQSSVCLKQLAFDLLELLLLSSFPELDYVFKQLHEDKDKFGEFKSQ